MTNIKSFPNNADEFIGAEPLMKWFHGRTSGVWAANGNAAVHQTPVASMQVEVEDGSGWLSNANNDGIAWWNEIKKTTGSNLTLSIDRADPALDRIDRVVVSWPTITYADPPTISILKGIPASSPIPAKLTNSTTIRMISLAQIRIPAGALAITAAMITDERLDPEVCGIVTESMTVDSSAIYAQFRELLDNLRENIAGVQDGSAYIMRTGDSMKGPLQVVEPSAPEQAASAGYAARQGRWKTLRIKLPLGGWQGDSQTVDAEGIHATTVGQSGPAPTSPENIDAFDDARIYLESQAEGKLTYRYRDKPDQDIYVDVLYREVAE